MTDETPGIGHNAAPDALDDILAKALALTEQAARVPSPLPDLDTAGRAVALVKMLRIAGKRVKDAWEEPPPDPKSVEVRSLRNALEAAEKKIGAIVHVYRMVHELPEIASDFGPKAYARSLPPDITVDTLKVPREYMVPDEKAIRKALAAGETIEGVTVGPPGETTVIS